MTKLTKSINKLAHDRQRNDRYDDRHDGHKPRYCDGHREESVVYFGSGTPLRRDSLYLSE